VEISSHIQSPKKIRNITTCSIEQPGVTAKVKVSTLDHAMGSCERAAMACGIGCPIPYFSNSPKLAQYLDIYLHRI